MGQSLDQPRIIDLGYLHHAFEHRKAFADPFRLYGTGRFSRRSSVMPVTSRPDEVSASAYLSQQADITCETFPGTRICARNAHISHASPPENVILFLHHRYRTAGGEERAVDDLMWLVRTQLDEPAELFARDSGSLGHGRAAAGLLTGGLDP